MNELKRRLVALLLTAAVGVAGILPPPLLGGGSVCPAVRAVSAGFERSMSTFSGQVSQSTDDGRQTVSGAVTLNSATDTLKNSSSPSTSAAYWAVRFQNVTVPAGATITAASLTVFCPGASPAMNAKIFGNKVANPSTLSTTTNYISGLAQTTASVTWNATLTGSSNNASPDISSIISELIGQGSWSSGNAMLFIFAAQSSSNSCQVENYDGNTSEAAQLSITYTTTTAPGSPSALSVTSTTTSSVSLSWTQGSGTVTDNIIEYSTDNATWTTDDLGSAATSGTVSGLSANTLYYFRVAAKNTAGTSTYSYYTYAYTGDTISRTVTLKPSGADILTTGWAKIGGDANFAATLADTNDANYAQSPGNTTQLLIVTLANCPADLVAVTSAVFNIRIQDAVLPESGVLVGFQAAANRSGTTTAGYIAPTVTLDPTSGSGFQNGSSAAQNYTTNATFTGTQGPTDWTGGYLVLQGDDTGAYWVSEANVTITYWARLVTSSPSLPLEFNDAIAATTTLPIESRQNLQAAPSEPIEWLTARGAIPTLPLEARLSVAGTTTLPIEAKAGVADPVVLPLEWGNGLVAAGAVLPLEWGQTTVPRSSSPGLPIEFLLTASNGATAPPLPIEWLGVTNISSLLRLPLEWRLTLAKSLTLPIEPRAGVSTKPSLPIEWGSNLTPVSLTKAFPLEFLAAAIRTAASPLEWRTPLAPTWSLPLELLAGVKSLPPLPVEFLGSGKAVALVSFFPLEWRAQLAPSPRWPIEYRSPVSSAAQLAIETRLQLAAAPTLPIEFRAALANLPVLPAEWKSAAVVKASSLPLEWRALLAGLAGLPIESKQQVAQTAVLPIEPLGGLRSLFAAPLEPLAAAKLQSILPVEFLGSGKSVVSAPSIPIEWRAALVGLFSLPIESRAELALAPALPLEMRCQLALLPPLPIAWHLAVAANAPTLPIEVLNRVVQAGAVLPIEWFADAMPDYSGGVFKLPKRGHVFCLDARGTVFVLGKRGRIFKQG